MRCLYTPLLPACLALLLSACATPGGTSAGGPSTGGPSAAAPSANQSSTAPAGAKLDDKGYIRQWLVLAPINFGSSYNADDIDKDQLPNEAHLAPKPGDKQTVKSQETKNGADVTVDKQLTWQPVTPPDNVLDFNAVLGLDSSDNVGAYAVAYLVAPEEMKDVTFSLSSNDDGKIFLNGDPIWSYVGGRALEEDSDKVDGLTLHKGVNTLIFKVWNDAGNWQACLRILDKSGKPVNNVTVKLSK